MDLLEQHARALAEFDRRVRTVPPERWDAPTACDGWDVRDLVNHLVAEQRWAPHLLRGETLDDVGDRYDGDLLGDDPVAVWAESSARARDAFTAPGATEGTVHTSMGELPTEEYLRQMTLDLAVHAWDLAQGTGAPTDLDPALVDELYATWAPRTDLLASSGVFDPPVDVDADADRQTKLLAVLGRDAR
jgi:uncharacterized protein (TIGR03086 family)